jgi:hypothetical protein
MRPEDGKTSVASFTWTPFTQTDRRFPSEMHSTRVHSPGGLSTSFFPRVSRSSLKSGSWFDHQNCYPE